MGFRMWVLGGRRTAVEVTNPRERLLCRVIDAASVPPNAGLAPASSAPRTLVFLDSLPVDRGVTYWKASAALSGGDVARARALLDSPLASDSATNEIPPPAYFRALRAWASIAEGDTLRGLAALRASLMETGYDQRYFVPRLPLVVNLARTQAAWPEARTEGIDRLNTLLRGYLYDQRSLDLPLARALEAAGRTKEARAAYRRFVAAWADADASARPRVEEARRALARLGSGP